MNLKKIWNERDWTKQARDIIGNLEKFPANSNIILVLRHSQRNEPDIFDDVQDLNLTKEGRIIANFFGKKLPMNRPVRLFHSKVERCRDTAEEIINGFNMIGGYGVLRGICPALYNLGLNRESFFAELKKYETIDIFYRWIGGVYSPELWPPITPYCQKAGQLIWREAKNAPESGVDIHISHDINVMTLKLGWFGMPPNNNWVTYLGGFAFTIKADHILLLNYGQLKKIEMPYWWKSE